MKKTSILLLIILFILCAGCSGQFNTYDLVATTLPVYDFTTSLCAGTPLTVGRLISENVSCLHDYTLQVGQMRMIEAADMVVISGAGLEDFLHDALQASVHIIDASEGLHVHSNVHHDNADSFSHSHNHEQDPHIWLSPQNATLMAINIYEELCKVYPQYSENFEDNLQKLTSQLSDLQSYGNAQLTGLSYRELITFHEGFAYFAESFDLTILAAIEEESGSEASALEVVKLIDLVNSYRLPAVFAETNGSDACARIIVAETGAKLYTLDMAMAGNSYFDAMYHNIDTIKEALK